MDCEPRAFVRASFTKWICLVTVVVCAPLTFGDEFIVSAVVVRDEVVDDVQANSAFAVSGRAQSETGVRPYDVVFADADEVPACKACASSFHPTTPLRQDDEVWLISTRHVACQDSDNLCVHRFQPGLGFVASSAEEYFGTANPMTLTTTYVHGNRVEASTAVERGFEVYNRLAAAASDDQRLRHTIWSWPSETIPGPVRDARVKATKTFLQSYVLADFVSRHDTATKMSLIGFSYGGRIILGAQHLLGGGDLFERMLGAEACNDVPRIRVAIWAPAVPAAWLHPEGLNGCALVNVDHMVMFYNTRDPMLRFYRKKLAESSSDALGFRGICAPSLGAFAGQFSQYNAASVVGSHHKWTRYMGAESVVALTISNALWR